MTSEQNAKVDAGVTACLDRCTDSSRYFTCVSGYVNELRASGAWIDVELSELQIRVIRILLKRYDGGEAALAAD
jgi:hypothetical protein